MEDFGKIKEISLEEAKKILPKDIAYLTMNDGEIIIVNGLDHMKFDQREKDYEDWMEKQTKSKFSTNINENGLLKIPENSEEYEKNSNHLNKQSKLYEEKNIQNNCNQNYDQNSIPQQKNNNDCSSVKNQQYQNGINSNNNNYLLYKSNGMNNRINNINFQNGSNNMNSQMMNIPQKNYFINSNYNPNNNNNYVRYKPVPRNMSYERLFKPYTPLIKRLHIQTWNIERKIENDKYISYNNHTYFERK